MCKMLPSPCRSREEIVPLCHTPSPAAFCGPSGSSQCPVRAPSRSPLLKGNRDTRISLKSHQILGGGLAPAPTSLPADTTEHSLSPARVLHGCHLHHSPAQKALWPRAPFSGELGGQQPFPAPSLATERSRRFSAWMEDTRGTTHAFGPCRAPLWASMSQAWGSRHTLLPMRGVHPGAELTANEQNPPCGRRQGARATEMVFRAPRS